MNLRNIQNKRGFLLGEETIKIIIGLIVIILLVVFLANLYYSKVKEEKQKQAFSSLNGSNLIQGQINLINMGGQPAAGGIRIEVPVGWHIFAFTGNEIKPNVCVGENCLCICSEVVGFNLIDWTNKRERQAGECDEDGACLVVRNLIGNYKDSIEIESGGTQIVFKSDANSISVTKI